MKYKAKCVIQIPFTFKLILEVALLCDRCKLIKNCNSWCSIVSFTVRVRA